MSKHATVCGSTIRIGGHDSREITAVPADPIRL
eukprot:SAG11_NODE_28905_length_316_cov_0.953917_1_plen_32_part_01